MGAISLVFAANPVTQPQTPISHNYHRRFADENYTSSRIPRHRCFSRWDRRSRFRDSYVTDEEVEYGSRNTAKRRRWWSDDDDYDDDEGFGILDASIGFDWLLKFFRAFGWVIPVAAVSLFVGTGPNTVIMAVALPLAQSALSLAADALWGTSYEPSTPKSNKRKKKMPSAGSASRTRVKREQETRFQRGKEYKSWMDADDGKRSRQDFGGWDELDNAPRTRPVKEEPRVDGGVQVSRRAKGETPLLIRLLIAMFPNLGFWTNFF